LKQPIDNLHTVVYQYHMGVYCRNKIWWIGYTDASGNWVRESSGSIRKTDAQAILEKRKTEVRENRQPILRKIRKTNFSDFVKTFLKEYQGQRGELAPATLTSYEVLSKKIVDFFGKLSLEQMADHHIDRYVKERRQESSWGRGKRKISKFTINRELGLLRLILNWAVSEKKLRFNQVAVRLSRKKMFEEPPRTRYFTEDELHAMSANASEPLKQFIFVGINTGMRLSEVQGLSWSEVDIKDKTIHLPADRVKRKRARDVRLNKSMVDLLEKLKLKKKGEEFVFPNPKTGKPYGKYISHTWHRLLKKCGIKNPGRFHDLRRTFGTMAFRGGAGVKDVQDQLGHRDPSTTLRIYAQATVEGKQKVVDLVNFTEPAGELVDLPDKIESGK
jgi:integrase